MFLDDGVLIGFSGLGLYIMRVQGSVWIDVIFFDCILCLCYRAFAINDELITAEQKNELCSVTIWFGPLSPNPNSCSNLG